jgi:hypothetical protein
MTTISHLVEPERLLLTWQPPDESAPSRTRRVVGEVIPSSDRSSAVFRYLSDGDDFARARALGFRGFPAFTIDHKSATEGVLDAFLRRLPPRKREDFADFLTQHWLPHPFPLSDFALLGYTGAKLPSDGFALVPVFSPTDLPCEYIMEVAGTRHVLEADLSAIELGDTLAIVSEPGNPVDSDALAILHGNKAIGYVNRAMRPTFYAWLEAGRLQVTVVRKNGKPGRPLIYCKISVARTAPT